MDAEKNIQSDNVQHNEEPRPSGGKRGSIYQIVPPAERRMSAQGRRISVVDDIFGEIKEDGPNYRNVKSPQRQPVVDVLTELLRLGGLELPY